MNAHILGPGSPKKVLLSRTIHHNDVGNIGIDKAF